MIYTDYAPHFPAAFAVAELASHLDAAGYDAEALMLEDQGTKHTLNVTPRATISPVDALRLEALSTVFYVAKRPSSIALMDQLFYRYLALAARPLSCQTIIVPNAVESTNLPLVQQVMQQEQRQGYPPVLRGTYIHDTFVAIEGSHRAYLCMEAHQKPLVVDIANTMIGYTDLGGFVGKCSRWIKLVENVLQGSPVAYTFA